MASSLPMSLEAVGASCDELWYARNAILHKLGYCFDSPLGRAVFDNTGCIGKHVALGSKTKRDIATIRALETQFECAVDTNRTRLDIPDLSILRRLTDIPVPDELASGCLGWTGPTTELRAGHSRASAVIGSIRPGDWVYSGHWNVDDWIYVVVKGPNWTGLESGGWLEVIWKDQLPCREHAG